MTDDRSAPPGWYRDPAGLPGQDRYWDGRTWSGSIRPQATSKPGRPPTVAPPPTEPDPSRPTSRPVLIPVVAVAALALVLVLVIALRPWSSPTPTQPRTSMTPSPATTGPICAERSPEPDPGVPTVNGRVQSGRVSYPQLAEPFGAPSRTTLLRFAYLDDVASQFAVLSYQGEHTGGAEVMVAGMPVIDGFTTPRQTAELLHGCIRDRFPGGVERDEKTGSATIAGREAWSVRTHLGYGGTVAAGVRSGTVIVVVLAVAAGEDAVFYAYLPDTHPELVPRAEAALAHLEVS